MSSSNDGIGFLCSAITASAARVRAFFFTAYRRDVADGFGGLKSFLGGDLADHVRQFDGFSDLSFGKPGPLGLTQVVMKAGDTRDGPEPCCVDVYSAIA